MSVIFGPLSQTSSPLGHLSIVFGSSFIYIVAWNLDLIFLACDVEFLTLFHILTKSLGLNCYF